MTDIDDLPFRLLRAGSTLVERIHTAMVARGYDDLRPAHGFAFARIAPDGATASEVAAHLGMTKQAAAQLLDELARKGYVERRPHPDDGRARLVVLTDKGRAATRTATEAAAEAVRPWAEAVGQERLGRLSEDLGTFAGAGRLRPVW